MGGLAELIFGKGSGPATWAAENQNALGMWGAGVASGKNLGDGLARGVPGIVQGRALDAQTAKEAQQISKLSELVGAKYPDLAQAIVDGADPKDVFNEYMQRTRPAEPTAPKEATETVAGRTQLAEQYGLTGRDRVNFILGGKLAEGGGAPALTEVSPGATMFDPVTNQGVFTAPVAPKAPGSLSVTAQKELFEAEDAATAGQYVLSALDQAEALNDKAYDGPMADLRGDTTALFGNQEGVATAQLKNVTTELALSQLKTIFGSMPTEGERKILLEMQGSVNQPKMVRSAIYKRAKEMAQRRIEDNKRKAASLRSGQFFEEGYSGTPQGGGAPAAQGGDYTILSEEDL